MFQTQTTTRRISDGPRMTFRMSEEDERKLDLLRDHLRAHGRPWANRSDVLRHGLDAALRQLQLDGGDTPR